MRSRALQGFVVASAALLSTLTGFGESAYAAPTCTVNVSRVNAGLGATGGLTIVNNCVRHVGDDGGSGVITSRTIVCGEHGTPADAPLVRACGGGPGLAADVTECVHSVNGNLTPAAPFATAPIEHGRVGKAQLWCPGDVVPALAQDAIRAEAIRLLPHVGIGAAPAHTSLVDIETVLWAATATGQDLPAADVLGTDVRLRITFDHADWTFGDGEHDSTTDPGKPYDAQHDPCRTKQCADYYGHTYLRPGRRTVTLAITWTARFSLDAGVNWTDLDQPVTGAKSRHTVRVRETRAVLVGNPGGH